jgi:hypothetical protein
MFVAASTTPSATPYSASAAANATNTGASAITGTHTAIRSRPARSTSALSRRLATTSAASEPTPASSTIISSRTDISTDESDHLSCTSGSRVVRLMKTRPCVKKPDAAANRACRRAGATSGACVAMARP